MLLMATVAPFTDEDAQSSFRVQAVFEDIRATRGSDFVNYFWRALAHEPGLLERTWRDVKEVMLTPAPGGLDPLTRELVYIAVSIANGCAYCVHSHTASARAKGLTAEQHEDLLAVIALASQTNALATALGVPVDPEFSR